MATEPDLVERCALAAYHSWSRIVPDDDWPVRADRHSWRQVARAVLAEKERAYREQAVEAPLCPLDGEPLIYAIKSARPLFVHADLTWHTDLSQKISAKAWETPDDDA